MPLPVFDGHNDVLLRLHLAAGKRSFFEHGTRGHLDLPRARAGGFAGGFFAVFVPPLQDSWERFGRYRTDEGYSLPLAPAYEHDRARETALAEIDLLHRLVEESAGEMEVVRSVEQLDRCLETGVLAAVLHLEGAEPVAADLDNLEELYERGLRSLGIVWSRPNAFGNGVPFRFPATPDIGEGLTAAGRALVVACRERGILIDLAHLNARGFWDAAEVTERPLVVTHACVHALSPTARNLTDEQLDAVAATRGVVGVNFHVADLRADGRPDPDTPLATLVQHIDYIAQRLGVDCVALGSDFEGALMPRELGDAAGLPRLLAALEDHGFGAEDMEKITHGNWRRVLAAWWHPGSEKGERT